MTEYQIKRNKKCDKRYHANHRNHLKEIKERDNMINMAMRLLYEFEDMSAALRYVKWKVRKNQNESVRRI